MEKIEIRCPVGPKRLFAKLRLEGGTTPRVTEENWVEFSCADCRKTLRTQGKIVSLVLHRFDFFGELAETVVEK